MINLLQCLLILISFISFLDFSLECRFMINQLRCLSMINPPNKYPRLRFAARRMFQSAATAQTALAKQIIHLAYNQM